MEQEFNEIKSLLTSCMSKLSEYSNFLNENQRGSPPDRNFIRVSEACKLLNICRKTLHTRTKEGLYKAYKLGGVIYYDKEELGSAIKRNPL